jgi:hypothetical protein
MFTGFFKGNAFIAAQPVEIFPKGCFNTSAGLFLMWISFFYKTYPVAKNKFAAFKSVQKYLKLRGILFLLHFQKAKQGLCFMNL